MAASKVAAKKVLTETLKEHWRDSVKASPQNVPEVRKRKCLNVKTG